MYLSPDTPLLDTTVFMDRGLIPHRIMGSTKGIWVGENVGTCLLLC